MAEKDLVVGIDLGGTRFRVALFDLAGKIVRRQSWLTEPASGPMRVIERLASATREVCTPEGLARIAGVGLGSPGPLDPWSGIILETPNMPGWDHIPLASLMSQYLGVPAYIGNDANLAALGEFFGGAGKGLRNLVYFTVSTGIGSGIIINGRLLLGAHGLAGELGHTTILPDGPLCGCGNFGCLEALASGTAIGRDARARLAAGEVSELRELVGDQIDKVDAQAVAGAALSGDPLSLSVFGSAARYLGIGVVNALHAFDPEILVIGGGVSRAGDLLFGPVRKVINERAMAPYRNTPVVPAALGDDAGLVGAAVLVLTELGLTSST